MVLSVCWVCADDVVCVCVLDGEYVDDGVGVSVIWSCSDHYCVDPSRDDMVSLEGWLAGMNAVLCDRMDL